MGSECPVHFVIVEVNVIIRGKGALGNPQEATVMPVAAVQHLVDHLSKIDLYRLSRDEPVVPKIAILPAAFPEGQNV
jgi:hypothetical protein